MHARRLRVAVFADSAAFSVVASSAIAVPAIFSISQPDVFALPKTILTLALAGLLAGLLTVREIASGPRPWPPYPVLTAALVVFVGWNLLAFWFAIDRQQALFGERLQFQGLASILAYVVFLIAAWITVRGPRRQSLLLASVAAGASLVATYALVQRAGLDPIWLTLPHDRVFSTIGQANALAAYLVLVVPLILSLAAGRRLAAKVAVVSVVALAVVALAFTLSRGGYLGLAAAAIVLGVLAWPKRKSLMAPHWLRLVPLAGVVVLVLVLSVPGIQAVAQRFAARALLTADLSEGSIKNHLDLWNVGIAIAADHPIVGTGQDTYVLLFGGYRDRVLSPERAVVMMVFRPESPHNVYLATAAGAGLPALAAYVAIVAAVVGRILGALRRTVDPRAWLVGAALLSAIVGHLVTDAFMTAETAGSVLFWTVLGMGAALAANSRRSTSADYWRPAGCTCQPRRSG